MNSIIRVLIVDDEERFRATTAAILTKRGFQATAAGSGFEAIEQVKKNEFDVVVLDVQMPGMDGNRALREIKNTKPDIAVLILTGHGTPGSALAGLRDGISDYLTKPCPIDILALKIREACALKSGVCEREPKVKQIMVPVSSFSTIYEDRTVNDAVKVILDGFSQTSSISALRETLHRSILVLDKDDDVVGIITLTDLLRGMRSPHIRLLADKPLVAEALCLKSPSYSGMFTILARDLATKTVRAIMPDAPPVIDVNSDLMKAATEFLNLNVRRLLVTEGNKIVGVIREQDLFFQMANVVAQHGVSNERQ
jgi:CheY-like chemotaxis protein/predicted transcriptional regulator